MAVAEHENQPGSTAQEESGLEDFAPVGTIAVMAVLAALIIGSWLFMYFGVLLSRGAVS